MFIMGIATALMGALPTAEQIGILAPILLLLLRILQGFALGGEWAGAVLLAVEHSPAKKRGLFGSILRSASRSGWHSELRCSHFFKPCSTTPRSSRTDGALRFSSA